MDFFDVLSAVFEFGRLITTIVATIVRRLILLTNRPLFYTRSFKNMHNIVVNRHMLLPRFSILFIIFVHISVT